jgi:UDP-galactopyranose mutase
MTIKYRYLIVGAEFTGALIAQELPKTHKEPVRAD